MRELLEALRRDGFRAQTISCQLPSEELPIHSLRTTFMKSSIPTAARTSDYQRPQNDTARFVSSSAPIDADARAVAVGRDFPDSVPTLEESDPRAAASEAVEHPGGRSSAFVLAWS